MFCSKCGRELQEGENCNCSPENNENKIKFSDTVMSTVHFARDMFVNPTETIKSYFSINYGKMSVKLILLKAFIAFLLAFAVAEVLSNSDTVLMYMAYSKIKFAVMAFCASISADVLFAVAISVSSRIFGCYLKFKACLQLVSIAVPMNMVFMVLAAFLTFVSIDSALYVLVFTIIPSSVLMAMGVMHIKGAGENKKMWIIIVGAFIVGIMAMILISSLLNTINSMSYLYQQTNPFIDGGQTIPFYFGWDK